MELLYSDDRVVVCIKPAGVVSVDEPGGLPDLVRTALGEPNGVVRTVHRLDQAVSGVMVLARTARAASDLSTQIRNGIFSKEYLAVVHGFPPSSGTLKDLLLRDKKQRITRVVGEAGKDVQEAVLDYCVVAETKEFSKLKIRLHTGRTHQIRVQFSSRDLPLVGDRKYGSKYTDCSIALWSHSITFLHPRTGEKMTFTKEPPRVYPWTEF